VSRNYCMSYVNTNGMSITLPRYDINNTEFLRLEVCIATVGCMFQAPLYSAAFLEHAFLLCVGRPCRWDRR